MRGKVSSNWLPSYIKAMWPVLQIFKMDGYFLDSPHTASPTYTLSNECKWPTSFMFWLLYHRGHSSWAIEDTLLGLSATVKWLNETYEPAYPLWPCVWCDWTPRMSCTRTHPASVCGLTLANEDIWVESNASLAFKPAYLWSVSMCHTAPNHPMTEKEMAARIFLSFKCLNGVTQQKHCIDNNTAIGKDTGRRERNCFEKNYGQICVMQGS
jgi:hypothetical protein